MGPIACPKTSVRNYYYLLCQSPEERISHLLHPEITLLNCEVREHQQKIILNFRNTHKIQYIAVLNAPFLALKWSPYKVHTLYIIICIFVFIILISCSRKGVDDSNIYVVTPLIFHMPGCRIDCCVCRYSKRVGFIVFYSCFLHAD
jgi:hypothetical protein